MLPEAYQSLDLNSVKSSKETEIKESSPNFFTKNDNQKARDRTLTFGDYSSNKKTTS